MKATAQKKHSTTQKFTQIQDITESVVLLAGAHACSVIEVTATNFALQSEQEQHVLIAEYGSFLNSLSFPIQILIRSKKLDISYYLKTLDLEAHKTGNPLLQKHILWYKDFVGNLVKTKSVLDKKFYIVIPFSSLELGVGGAGSAVDKKASKNALFVEQAKKTLFSKQQAITEQLKRMGLRFRVLEKEELAKLYYEIYNNQSPNDVPITESVDTPVVKTK